MSEYLSFERFETPKERKTNIWHVRSKHSGDLLGVIAWFNKWRKYVFYPEGNIILDEKCLSDLTHFCKDSTRKHKGLI